MCACGMSMCGCVCFRGVQVPGEARGGRRVLRTGITGYWELPMMSNGNQTQVLRQSSGSFDCRALSAAPRSVSLCRRAQCFNLEFWTISRFQRTPGFTSFVLLLAFLFIFMSYFLSSPYFSFAFGKILFSTHSTDVNFSFTAT